MGNDQAETPQREIFLRRCWRLVARRQLVFYVVIALLSLGALGYVAVPPLVKWLVQDQAARALHRPVSVGQIDFNPYALSLRVRDVAVKESDGREVAGFDELLVNLSGASLFKAAVAVDEIRLQGLRLSLIRYADGRYDISDLLDEWLAPKTEPDSGIPRFSLNNIQIVGANVSLEDRPRQRTHRVSDLTLAIPFISSLPYQAEIFVEPAFSATVNGAQLALKGRSKPFAVSHESELVLDLDAFDLAGLQPYLPESLPLQIASGELDAKLSLAFRASPDQVFSLAVSGGVHVSHLALTSSGQALLAWKRLDFEVEKFDPLARELALGRVALEAPEIAATVDRQGQLNWLRLAGPPTSSRSASSQDSPAMQWSLAHLEVSAGRVLWRDDSNTPAARGEISGITLNSMDLSSQQPVFKVAHLAFQPQFADALQAGPIEIRDVRLDLGKRRIDIGELRNSRTRASIQRLADGQIRWLPLPQLATPAAAPASAAGSEPGWLARLERLTVDDLALRFEDLAAPGGAIQEIERLSIRGQQLSNEPGQAGQLAVKAQVNRKGSLSLEGKVQAQPLLANLQVDAQALPLMSLQAYFDQYLNVAVTRGQVSAKGEFTARDGRDGLQTNYRGALTLGDFLAVDRGNSADFLKWKSLYFGALDFRSQPLALDIGEIALSDFYSRLILDARGQLNLQQLVRPSPSAAGGATANPAETAKKQEPAAPGLPLRIAKVTLQNGNVNFSDFFVKPNYSVNIGKLAGRVTGLSSAAGTTADVDLRGAYANAAPVRIQGKINPLASNPFVDLSAEVTGVDLVGFSPYAGKYAGYAIEKGKLSLNVAYKLENRQLNAENRLFIDQFTFGAPVDSPEATKLPVNLALSLLKNSRGEIDINLPISGSLDDPQFSVGGLVVKVIVNLFVKAVTSPFALLGSMFGGGEELSTVDFAPGRNSLDASAEKKLSALAKALRERSSLKLEIAGRADPEADKEGLRRVAIERAMQAEKLKDLQKKAGEGRSLDSIEISVEEYPLYLRRAYRAADFPKPRNLVGLQKDLPVAEMEQLLLTHLPADEAALTALAAKRAEVVQAWLVDKGQAPVERLFIVPAKAVAGQNGGKATQVHFSLK